MKEKSKSNFQLVLANFRFRAEWKKVTSRAEPSWKFFSSSQLGSDSSLVGWCSVLVFCLYNCQAKGGGKWATRPASTTNPKTNKQTNKSSVHHKSLILGDWAYPVWTGHRGPCLTRFGSGGKIKSYRHHYEERKAINLMGGFFYSSEYSAPGTLYCIGV